MSAIEFDVREGVDYTDVNEKGTGRYVGGFLGSMRKPDAAGDMILTTRHIGAFGITPTDENWAWLAKQEAKP